LIIRIGLSADPDPAFYLNADPDPGCETNANPCGSGSGSWSDFAIQKVGFDMNSIPTLCRKYVIKHTKAILKGWKSGLFVYFGKFFDSWIRIRIPYRDPDSEEPKQCGFMRIRIRITENT
jgi:hypothetical protein